MPDQPPNVLFFFTDQHRADWVGHHADVPVRTPHLDELTAAGVHCTNAVTPSPLCAPARACLAAGVEYDRSPVSYAEPFPLEQATVYEQLRDQGEYHVMGCGKFDLRKADDDNWGLDGTRHLDAYGFSAGINNAGKWDAVRTGAGEPADPYMAYLHNAGYAADHVADFQRRQGDHFATFPTALPEPAYADNWIARNGMELLTEAPTDRPWHLTVNFNGPHDPWDVTTEMHGLYRDPPVDFDSPVDPDPGLDRADHLAVCRNYAAMIENIDRWLGRYRARLAARGELVNTLIVFASDHGEMLGDHGEWRKRAPYRGSVRVPLLLSGPDVQRRGRVGEPVSLIDLAATFLDYAGLDPAWAPDARSLRPYLSGDRDTHRDVVFSGLDPWRMAYDGRYKLITGCDISGSPDQQVKDFPTADATTHADAAADTEPVLFDLHSGDETQNVIADHPTVTTELSEALARQRQSI